MAGLGGTDATSEQLETLAMQSAVAAAGIGTWSWNALTGHVRWDATLEALSGLPPGSFENTFEAWLQAIHPDDRTAVVQLVEDAVARRSAYRFEHRTVWPDGSVRWLECRGEVITDAGGNALGTVGCAIDVTVRKQADAEQQAMLKRLTQAAERIGRLQRLSQQLAVSFTMDEVVAAVVETLDPPHRTTARALWLIDPLDEEVLVLAGSAGMKPEAAAMFERIDLHGDLPGAVALREQRTVVSPSQADSIQRFPELRLAPRTGPGFIAVPLMAEGRGVGVLALGYHGELDDGDLMFIEAAAGNIAETMARVRLAASLERRSEEIAFLAEVTRLAITATDLRDLMQRIVEGVAPRLGELCALSFVPEPGARVETAVAHREPDRTRAADSLVRSLVGTDGEHGAGRVLRTGQPEVLREARDLTVDTRRAHSDPHLAKLLEELEGLSVYTLPLRSDGRTVGTLQVFTRSGGRRESERDLALAEAVADGLSDVLQTRWVTDQHRHISTTLQRAFLPPALPEVPGLDVAAAYWPAGPASDVGGDFYDLFPLGDQHWAVLIGDACGTGPDAAATAVIARHTARAAARHGLAHAEVLEWVNQAVKQSGRGLFCTASFATIRADLSGGSIRVILASGGHPLPIGVLAGNARLLGAPGTLLGVFDDVRFVVAEVDLFAGDSITFYTDGLTDLPGRGGRSEEELRMILEQEGCSTAGDIVRVLRRDLDERRSLDAHTDDVAVLVIRNRLDAGADRD